MSDAVDHEAPRAGTTQTGQERNDLLESLARHRDLLRGTVRGLTDEQGGLAPTASELTLLGIVKHVTDTEAEWADFMVNGDQSAGADGDQDWGDVDWDNMEDPRFSIEPGTTVTDLLQRYVEVAAHTDALVTSVDLNASHALPTAPWFEVGARWSARRVLLHIIAETAQHAGHADIIRESIDGAKSMG